ncbi:MAG: HAD family hydrolase [Promethearchaeota archaeon]|nr:MAG: HAD family hydrolase [Candidatus Lokiarchaeota archaeon]
MIKAVSFDFWFTIASIDKNMDNKINEIRKRRLITLFERYRIPIKSEEIIPRLLKAKNHIRRMKKEKGDVDFSNRHIGVPIIFEYMVPEIQVYLSRVKPPLKVKLLDEFSDILSNALISCHPPLTPDVDKAIEYAKLKGFKVGIVSNTGLTGGKSLRKVIDQYKILHFFDETAFSDEVGLQKPNPKIFENLASKLKIDVSEILHVGDTIFADIVGARNAGLHEGILYLGVFDDNYQERKLEEDFLEFKPRYVIDDYRDFPETLNAIVHGKTSYLKIHNKKIRNRLQLE